MEQRTKKQHYVPQCYLKAWSIAEKHQIYVYDKKTDSRRINNIEDVASERFFYDVNPNDVFSESYINQMRAKGFTWDSEEKSQGIEHAFAQEIEGPFSKYLSELIEKARSATPWHINTCYFINAKKKAEFAVYLALQFLRIKSVRSRIQDSADCLNQALTDMGCSDSFINEYSVSKDTAKKIHSQMIIDPQLLIEITSSLFALTWMLGVNKTRKVFYTSDSPICTYGHIKDPIRSMNGIASKGVEVFFPLSPDVILLMIDGTYHKHFAPFDRRYVDITDDDNIEFYNSLLAAHAERFVFSSDGCMELIDKMKREIPDTLYQSHVQLSWGGKTYYPRVQ